MTEYIERDKLYNNLVLLAKYEIGERQQGILGCAETVRMCPAVDVAPVVHGRWETHYRSGTTVPKGVVSGCCDMWNERKTPYCPYCGAKMDGKDGDDNAVD